MTEYSQQFQPAQESGNMICLCPHLKENKDYILESSGSPEVYGDPKVMMQPISKIWAGTLLSVLVGSPCFDLFMLNWYLWHTRCDGKLNTSKMHSSRMRTSRSLTLYSCEYSV